MFQTILGYPKYLFKNIKDTWGQLLTLVIPLALSIPPAQAFLASSWYILTPTIVIFLVGFIHATKFQMSYKQLKEKFEDLNQEREILQLELESVPERIVKSLFNFFDFKYTERITLYRFDDTHFVPTGRYSKNKEYKKSGRTQYPKSEGFIGLAWATGEYEVNSLPESSRRKYYQAIRTHCNIDESTLRDMKMKSRAYYCVNLDDEHGDPVAVIVFESTHPNLPRPPEEIGKLLKGSYGQLLVSAIKVNLK